MVVDVIETHTNHCWGFDDHSNDHSNAAFTDECEAKGFWSIYEHRGNEFLGGCGIRRNTSITAM